MKEINKFWSNFGHVTSHDLTFVQIWEFGEFGAKIGCLVYKFVKKTEDILKNIALAT